MPVIAIPLMGADRMVVSVRVGRTAPNAAVAITPT